MGVVSIYIYIYIKVLPAEQCFSICFKLYKLDELRNNLYFLVDWGQVKLTYIFSNLSLMHKVHHLNIS